MTDAQIEVDWERGAVQRGVERYRDALVSPRKDGTYAPTALAELEPGQRIVEDVLRSCTAAVQARQDEARVKFSDVLMGKAGRVSLWWTPVLELDPATAVYITARTILTVPSGGAARDYNGLVMRIATHLQAQREFEQWQENEKAAVKEAREAGVWRPNWWRLMQERSPKIDERAWKKWRDKSQHHERMGWSQEMKAQIGSLMLNELVIHGGGWFEVQVVRKMDRGGYKEKRVVNLSAPALAWVQGRHENNELTRPWLVPMLVEPLDWKWTETTNDCPRAVA